MSEHTYLFLLETSEQLNIQWKMNNWMKCHWMKIKYNHDNISTQ